MSYGHYCGIQSNIRTQRMRLRSWLRAYLPLKCIDDELQGLRLHALDTLLHHVVTVLVFHTLQDMAVQLPYHLILLGGEKDKQKAPPGLTADKRKAFTATRGKRTRKAWRMHRCIWVISVKLSSGWELRWSLLCYRNHLEKYYYKKMKRLFHSLQEDTLVQILNLRFFPPNTQLFFASLVPSSAPLLIKKEIWDVQASQTSQISASHHSNGVSTGIKTCWDFTNAG